MNSKANIKKFSIHFSSLFARLLFYFLIVMLIPLIILIFSYVALGSNALRNTLTTQSENTIALASNRMQSLIDEYRHKTYLISTDEEIKEVITGKKETSGSLYEKLFSIMSEDTYPRYSECYLKRRKSSPLYPPVFHRNTMYDILVMTLLPLF